MSEIVRVVDLVKEYKSGDAVLHVLKGINLSVEAGEMLAVVGPSGSGKSTLLHLMGFLDHPTSGEIVFHGNPITRLNGSHLARLRNEKIGFVFQMYHLLPELDVLENAILPMMIRYSTFEWWGKHKEVRQRARELLDRLGLGGRLHHRPHQLSGGECQRVAIARALMPDPEIVYCDEPTGNLDFDTAQDILKLIVSLNQETKKTFVIVTHDERIAAMAHRKVRLVDGRMALP